MASTKFAALRDSLKEGRVLVPGDEGFEESLMRWSLTQVKPAAAVAMPKTTAEVSAVVRFAADNNIAFNVKGGGHSTSSVSCAPSAEGMVLDLGLLRSVHVDAEARTVTFGGGCLWGDVDDALWPHGLATPGGTVSHTGVGGLILHGGFGIISGVHGLTLDCLVECEVVLADGSVVTASEAENSDLFWGLRGAGSSFGVVTSFTSRAFPQGDVYSGMLMFAPDKLAPLVDFLNHWERTTTGPEALALVLTHLPLEPGQEAPPGGRPPAIMVLFIHAGADAETAGPEYFAPVLELEALFSKVGMVPYPAFNKATDDARGVHKRYQFGGANFTLPAPLATVQAIAERFWALSPPSEGLADSMLLLEAIPGTAIRRVPVDSMAFNSRGDYYNIGIIWKWTDAALDAEMRTRNRGFQAELRGLGYDDAAHKDGVGRYLNYADEALEAEAAFGSHAQRLRQLKQRYDPGNVFDKLWKLVGQVEEQRAGGA